MESAGSGALRQAWQRVSHHGGECECTDGAHLNEVLAFWLGDQRLELRGGEGVDQTSLGDDEQQDLGTGQDGQFVSLRRGAC